MKVKNYFIKNFDKLQKMYNYQERNWIFYQKNKGQKNIDNHPFNTKIISDFDLVDNDILFDFQKTFRWYERYLNCKNTLCMNEFLRCCSIIEYIMNELE